MARRSKWQLAPDATPEQLAELAKSPRLLRQALKGAQRAAMPSSAARQASVAAAKDEAARRA